MSSVFLTTSSSSHDMHTCSGIFSGFTIIAKSPFHHFLRCRKYVGLQYVNMLSAIYCFLVMIMPWHNIMISSAVNNDQLLTPALTMPTLKTDLMSTSQPLSSMGGGLLTNPSWAKRGAALIKIVILARMIIAVRKKEQNHPMLLHAVTLQTIIPLHNYHLVMQHCWLLLSIVQQMLLVLSRQIM